MNIIWKSILLLLLSVSSHATIRVPQLISDGMILQRDSDVAIWGWADPLEKINITFFNKSYKTKTDSDGNWNLVIKTGKAGGPFEMIISGSTDTIKIKDILFGDVFLCSGQSNMAFKLERIKERYAKDIENSTNNNIRQFSIKSTWSPYLKEDVESQGWINATPQSVNNFSAVAYFFAQQLYCEHQVPIGIIDASYSATVAEGWISKEGLINFPDFIKHAEKYNNYEYINSIIDHQNEVRKNWFNTLEQKEKSSDGYNNISNTDLSGWDSINVPGFWSTKEMKNFTGSVWFKKEIKIDEELLTQECKLYPGAIDDRYTIYINGIDIGSEWRRGRDRDFIVPQHALSKGTNILTIQIINPEGQGGFYRDRPYKLKFNNKEIDLTGQWKYKVGVKMPELSSKENVKFNLIPTFLFNGMINPLKNYKIKGVLWYQGEGNVSRGMQYRELFHDLILNWRNHWQNDNLPFLFVQLSSYGNPKLYNTSWAVLREAQQSALLLPNTGMAVTYDIGEANNIHPGNKKEVGRRLSLLARQIIYDEDIKPYGPIFKQMEIKGKEIHLEFDNFDSSCINNENSPLWNGFYISDHTRKFYPASVHIHNGSLVISNNKVDQLITVRYAWLNNSLDANFYNEEGLPALPFRTDNWKDAKYEQNH